MAKLSITEKYDAIYEELVNRVKRGELTVEQAEVLNDAAFTKFVENCDGPELDPEPPVTENTDEVTEKCKKDKEECDDEDCDCKKASKKKIKKKKTDDEEETEDSDKSEKEKEDETDDNEEPDEDAGEVEEDGENGEVVDNGAGDPPSDEENESCKKESVDVDPNEVKLHIYEAFDNGSITAEEKAMFLAILE